MSNDERQVLAEVVAPRFQVNDQILAPRDPPTIFGRCWYEAARVLDVEIDADHVEQLTCESLELPGLEMTCRADDVLPWTCENLLREINDGIASGGVDELVHTTPPPPPDTVIHWLKMAAENRNTLYFTCISQSFPDLPYSLLGYELLGLVCMPRHIPPVKPFWECPGDQNPIAWVSDMEELVQFICHLCGILVNPEALLPATERSLEHLAVACGDTKLLLWILKYRIEKSRDTYRRFEGEVLEEGIPANERGCYRFRRDDHGRTPLHVAVLLRHEEIIYIYHVNEAAERLLGTLSILDFNAKDENGQSVLDLASAIEDTDLRDAILAALHKLQRQIYQGILDRTMTPLPLVRADIASLSRLEQIVARFNLEVGRHYNTQNLKNVIYAVAEQGDVVKLRWLVKNVEAIDLHCCVASDNLRIGLLHAAARRSTELRYLIQRPYTSDKAREDFEAEKMIILQQWNGTDDMTAFKKNYTGPLSMFSERSYSRFILDACGRKELAPHRIALAEWLVGKWLTLPDCHFLIHECDFAPAAYLLQYRFDIDSIVSGWFLDRAPQAVLLVNEYLHGKDDLRNNNPRNAALICCERVSSDPHNLAELAKLKFLQLLIRCYDVDPRTLMNADGRTILEVALQNDFCLIALWLAANYRALLYIRAPNGRFPIHIALADEGVSYNICEIMCRFTGEAADGLEDRRIFALQDGEGKTVMDYMMVSNHERMRGFAHRKLWKQILSELVEMILDESTTAADFTHFTQSRHLDKVKCFADCTDWFPILHTAIGLGRLEFLCWLDAILSDNNHPSLSKSLSHAKGEYGSQITLPIICHPDIEPMLGDLLEVQCSFRTEIDDIILDSGQKFSPKTLDGTWKVTNWMPVDDLPAMMLVCDLHGTSDVAGMEECKFIPYKDGTLHVCFDNGGSRGERWFSSAATITPDIVRIELTRYKSDKSITDAVHPLVSRKLVMTKIKGLKPGDIHFKWRLATVQQSTAVELEVEYPRGIACSPYSNDDLCVPHREWISKKSMRINRSGVLNLQYDYHCHSIPFQKYQDFTGRAFAERCGHENIVSWIAKAAAFDQVKNMLNGLEMDFIEIFLTGASNDELEGKIFAARQILVDSAIPRDAVEALEASAYVLDRCWSEQPDSLALILHAGPGQACKPAIYAAWMNLVDRLCWIIDTDRLSVNSPHIRHALTNAAQNDSLEVVEKLLSFGVAPVEPLILTSVDNLSGKVACFLLENNLVAEPHLIDLLVTLSVRGPFFFKYDAAASEKVQERSDFRMKLIKMLGERGCFPTNPVEGDIYSTMEVFLSNLKFHHHSGDNRVVPVTRDALDVLCGFGGDIVSAMERQTNFGDFPPWIFEYIDKIKSDEKVMRELLGATTDLADQILTEPGRDITTLRDRCGRSLLELAAMTGKLNWVEWLLNKSDDFRLVTCRGVPLRNLCQQMGYTEVVLLLDEYQRGDE